MTNSVARGPMVINLFIEGELPSDGLDKNSVDPEDSRAKAITYLQSIIDGMRHLSSAHVPIELTRIHTEYKDDPDVLALFKASVKVYSAYALAKASEVLAK